MDWSLERAQYPDLASVILTEERGLPPHLYLPEDDERSQEQVQDAWFARLVSRNDPMLCDRAEEEYLAARHML